MMRWEAGPQAPIRELEGGLLGRACLMSRPIGCLWRRRVQSLPFLLCNVPHFEFQPQASIIRCYLYERCVSAFHFVTAGIVQAWLRHPSYSLSPSHSL